MATVVVIGGGPSGMMAAITASKKHKVILLERNEKLGKKLFITGKGRCNVTNSKDISEFFDCIPRNPYFLYSSLYSFTNLDTMNFLESNGVKLKVERGGRVFPESDKSSDIISAFLEALKKNNVQIKLNSKVSNFVVIDNKINAVKLEDQSTVEGDYFIICTGGVSYPQTGSTGDGLKFAKKIGHNIIDVKPSLVPIEVEEDWIKELQGLSLKNVELSIKDSRNKTLYKEFGEMLFTHFGLSGPIVLSGSPTVNNSENTYAFVNLKPALSSEELDKRIQNDFTKYINKNFKNALDDILPQKLIPIIIRLSGIDENKKVNVITKEERKNLVNIMQNLKFKIKGLRPIAEAIVTSGGVNVDEINPSTMQSKIASNVYFAGEVIDVDAYTGGYNIQIAISTGFIAGNAINEIE